MRWCGGAGSSRRFTNLNMENFSISPPTMFEEFDCSAKELVTASAYCQSEQFAGYGTDLCKEVAKRKAVYEYYEKNAANRRPFFVKTSDHAKLIDQSLVRYRGRTECRQSELLEFHDIFQGNSANVSADLFVSSEHAAKPGCIPLSTTGFAAHHTSAGACFNSVLELVERDTFFLHWYGNLAAISVKKVLEPGTIGGTLETFKLNGLCSIYVSAAILHPRNATGCVVGLGAGLTFRAAQDKAEQEAIFFYDWYLRHVKDPFGAEHLAPTSHRNALMFFLSTSYPVAGRLASGALLPPVAADVHEGDLAYSESDFLDSLQANQIDIWQRQVWCGSQGEEQIYVCQSIASGLIPQHCATGLDLDVSNMRRKLPDGFKFGRINGFHPIT